MTQYEWLLCELKWDWGHSNFNLWFYCHPVSGVLRCWRCDILPMVL